jgi:CRP-like cAMP-binding protein
MTSHESSTEELSNKDLEGFKSDRLDIAPIKYFWQASPLATNKYKSIPKFLRSIKVFEHFSDYEMKTFSDFIHERMFTSEEIIIKEGESGFGFYLIFSGKVEIYTKRTRIVDGKHETYQQIITRLSKHETFGEMALLEHQSKRNATAIAKGSTKLLAIYKPDIEELIERHPVVGAKFLQAMSLIVAKRFNQVTEELRSLKDKCTELESQVVSTDV